MTYKYNGIGIKDNEFIRTSAPMTKEEVRVLSLSKLKIDANDIVLDIGAGTGSVSIECGFLADKVIACEVNEDAISCIHQNIEKFGLDNIDVITGLAPKCLGEIDKVDKVFIGGSKGNLQGIFAWMDKFENLTVAANFITLENASDFIKLLKKHGYSDIDIVQVNISKGKSVRGITMMMGTNPVFIISGQRGKF